VVRQGEGTSTLLHAKGEQQ